MCQGKSKARRVLSWALWRRGGKRSLAARSCRRPSASYRAQQPAPAAPQPHEPRSDGRTTLPPPPPFPCLHARPRGSLLARRPREAQLGTRRAGGGGGADAQPRSWALVPARPAPLAAGGGRRGGRAAERGRFVCGKVWKRGAAPAPAEGRRDAYLRRGAASSPCSTLLSLAAGHGRLAAAVPARRRAGRLRLR